jgi:hypothetical protein
MSPSPDQRVSRERSDSRSTMEIENENHNRSLGVRPARRGPNARRKSHGLAASRRTRQRLCPSLLRRLLRGPRLFHCEPRRGDPRRRLSRRASLVRAIGSRTLHDCLSHGAAGRLPSRLGGSHNGILFPDDYLDAAAQCSGLGPSPRAHPNREQRLGDYCDVGVLPYWCNHQGIASTDIMLRSEQRMHSNREALFGPCDRRVACTFLAVEATRRLLEKLSYDFERPGSLLLCARKPRPLE